MKRWLLFALCIWLLPAAASAQCLLGPDAVSHRALQSAYEAQTSVADHLAVSTLDRESRELSDIAHDRNPQQGAITAQATLNFETSAVPGFSVCNNTAWESAKLQNQAIGAAASIGARGVARFEMRVFGVSDSVIQRDLSGYYPEREAGAQADVPGATGFGQGIWSARVELLDEVGLTIGRVSSHDIAHTVGWDEETDDDGNTSLSRSQTSHWGPGQGGRTFVAVSAPRFATGDLILGDNRLERLHLGTGWFVTRPLALRVDGGWDGLVEAGVVGADVTPLGRQFEARGLPVFTVRAAAEGTSSPLREASVTAGWHYRYSQAGLNAPGDLASFRLETGVYGGERVAAAQRAAFVPGVVARVDAVVPIYAVLRLSMWAGVNRASTITAVPDTIGRPEWGISFYATYAL